MLTLSVATLVDFAGGVVYACINNPDPNNPMMKESSDEDIFPTQTKFGAADVRQLFKLPTTLRTDDDAEVLSY